MNHAIILSVLLSSITAANAETLLPNDWDSALAGELVMERLITVTAPQVKGAHDAEMTIIGRHAYVVAEVNDDTAGESAGRPEIYSAMSIINLDTQKIEDVILIAKSEQSFENVTLPVGACFVPRILQKDEQTLRCYFASEQPGQRQSQTWYRDFDIKTRTFAKNIHKAKLKTAAGTFDMQPQYFHADAVAQGFKKPAKDFGLYLFDSFKQFDGQTYIAINNFPGKQNALAMVHEDLATFEILGHYNAPQSEQLSESAVNQLPDGSWMAICRNDGGNYHFTTSEDGISWRVGETLSFVSKGVNSKPTFDKFGDLYYLGWQESTRIHGVSRSVFNIDVSRDGKTWERKYRFESLKSFQYPTFREHEGVVWLCVTQGDISSSRKERIMFGMLETVGDFESQTGKSRKPISAPLEEPAIMRRGVKLFTDRDYTLTEAPDFLMGLRFLRTSIERFEVECVHPGDVYVMAMSQKHYSNQNESLLKQGFSKVDSPDFQLFPGQINQVFAWKKTLKPGDRLRFRKLAFLVIGKDTKIALIKPTVNKSPLPENNRLENGMPIAREISILPKFAGPMPGVRRKISIPTIDISGETKRHATVARGTKETYHGHCDTVLLPDGKTMFTAWTVDHAQLIGPLARSDDSGRTWSAPLDVPANWHQTANTPAIHRLIDPQGNARLVVFADGLDWRRKGKPPYPMHQAISEDDGITWTPMKPNGVQGEVPPKTIISFDEGQRLILWSDLPGFVVQSESRDGGQTWQREQRILQIPDRWGQPCVIRSPDGKQLVMLLRENSRQHNSLYSISNDKAQTWSEPRELPASLTGDRHVAKYSNDGRLVIAMRDSSKTSSTYGHYVAWVGRFEDVLYGCQGQYRIKLLHNAARTDEDDPGQGNADCGYSDLEVLPDGTFIATTYVKYQPGPEKNSVINTRFTLPEMDQLHSQP